MAYHRPETRNATTTIIVMTESNPDPAAMVRAFAGSGARLAGVWDRPPVQTAVRSPAPPANQPPAPTDASPPAIAQKSAAADFPMVEPEPEREPAPEPAADIDPSTRVIAGGPNRWLAQSWDGRRWRIRAITRTEADALARLKSTEPA
ncbi:hypothetical protein ACVW1A_005278 [Bradyrhizobium sp. LB1.3]